MLFLDVLLLSPIYGTIWAARKIQSAIDQERADEPEQITADLREQYMLLETGKITEEQFAAQEKILLDRLDEIEKRGSILAEEAEDEPDDGEEDREDR